MPQLNPFPTAVQATANSCWACAAREISNWYQREGQSGQNPIYDSDQGLATAWAGRTGDPGHDNIGVQQSAAAALEDLGYVNNTDGQALPTQDEITAQINGGRPLLAIVGGARPDPDPNPNFQNGHWVVIVGISDNQATIDVFDPDDGALHVVPYDATIYQRGSYWQNTSYVDPIE